MRRRLAGGADGLARLQERRGRYLRQTNVRIQIADPLRVELHRPVLTSLGGTDLIASRAPMLPAMFFPLVRFVPFCG